MSQKKIKQTAACDKGQCTSKGQGRANDKMSRWPLKKTKQNKIKFTVSTRKNKTTTTQLPWK